MGAWSDKWNGATIDELLKEYAAMNPAGFRGTTRPLISTQSFTFTVVDGLGGPPALMAHAVARAGQTVDWFGFGLNDALPLGAGLTKTATDADTNLAKGTHTNGVTDFVIQGISATCKGVRVQYAAATVPAAMVDADAIAAYTGNAKIVDPGALVMPPQGGSPVNLEDVLFQALITQISFTLEWDRGKKIPVGRLDQIPEGAAKSFLRASGLPDTSNRYKAFEGYPWRRKDKPDSQFTIRGQVHDRVVVPITNIALSGAAAPLVQAQNLFCDVTVRVHGVGIEQIGQV